MSDNNFVDRGLVVIGIVMLAMIAADVAVKVLSRCHG